MIWKLWTLRGVIRPNWVGPPSLHLLQVFTHPNFVWPGQEHLKQLHQLLWSLFDSTVRFFLTRQKPKCLICFREKVVSAGPPRGERRKVLPESEIIRVAQDQRAAAILFIHPTNAATYICYTLWLHKSYNFMGMQFKSPSFYLTQMYSHSKIKRWKIP